MKKIDVLFENDEILIINKPSGVAVQGGKGISHPLDKELPEQIGYPIFLVHRLDRQTNGLMIIAKSSATAAKWTKLISSKEVKKEYLALCIGKMPSKKGKITSKIIQHKEEKNAVTSYEVLEEKEIELIENKEQPKIKPNNAAQKIILSKIKLSLETGRMHQIRIHLAKQNCPIVGDDEHGNFKLNKIIKKSLGIKTLQLTATKLTFNLNGKEKTIELPPQD